MDAYSRPNLFGGLVYPIGSQRRSAFLRTRSSLVNLSTLSRAAPEWASKMPPPKYRGVLLREWRRSVETPPYGFEDF